MGKGIWIFGISVLIIAGLFVFAGRGSSYPTLESFNGDITIYPGQSCGCCGVYTGYFNSERKASTIVLEDISSFKRQKGIPVGMESCHTTIIGNYFVEGHVPLEAVEKLLQEKPGIAGIAMPGMPSGSPGMPGRKQGDFVIYGVKKDGSYSEFMRM